MRSVRDPSAADLKATQRITTRQSVRIDTGAATGQHAGGKRDATGEAVIPGGHQGSNQCSIDIMPERKTRERPFGLDMDPDEALERFLGVDPNELPDDRRSRHIKKASESSSPQMDDKAQQPQTRTFTGWLGRHRHNPSTMTCPIRFRRSQ